MTKREQKIEQQGRIIGMQYAIALINENRSPEDVRLLLESKIGALEEIARLDT